MPTPAQVSVRAIIGLFVVLALNGCSTRFQDFAPGNRTLEHTAFQVAVRLDGEVFLPSSTWLDQDRMLFGRYRENSLGHIGDILFASYDTKSRSWDKLENLALNHPCFDDEETVFVRPKVLPDGSLGYIIWCDNKPRTDDFIPQLRGRPHYLYAWNERTDVIALLFDFQENLERDGLSVDNYTFSPDMSEMAFCLSSLIYADLYRVQSEGHILPLVPHFFRACRPEWSPNGESIAFLGNETYSGTPPDEILFFRETAAIYRHPWDLYLVDARGGNLRKIAENFTAIGFMQWLPQDSRHLLLAAEYRNIPGIWLIDVETGRMARLWDNTGSFGLTPDGQQLIVYERHNEVFATLDGLDMQEDWTLLVFDFARFMSISTDEP